MSWLVDRSSYEKSEDEWGIDQRTRDDRTAATHLCAIHASLCGNKPRNARADRRAAQFKPTETKDVTQDKHKTKARRNTTQKRDMKDTFTVLSVMAGRNPFSPEASLRNIMNDVNSCSAVNVDTAKAIGERMLLSVVGQAAANYTFKHTAQAVTLGSKSSVRIDGKMVIRQNGYCSCDIYFR